MAYNILSYLRIPVLASSALAVVGSGLLYFKQNELIYPRNLPPGTRTPEGLPKPDQFDIADYDDLRIRTPDGESLSAYFIRPSNKAARVNVTILMFHGNAGAIGHRIPIAGVLEKQIGCNVLMLEYRGYGLSTGSPDEKGLQLDAQAGLDWIRKNEETKGSKIVVYGQSLGGAVGVHLVAANQQAGDIVGLILENTFLSIRKMIPSVFPPARYIAPFCHQRWMTEETLPKITSIPVLFLAGIKDEIVPPSHMTELFELCRAKKKIWEEFPNGSHNDTVMEPHYFEHITNFIDNEILAP